MRKMQRILELLWLLNAQMTGLEEPKNLSLEAAGAVRELREEIRAQALSTDEWEYVNREIDGCLRMYAELTGLLHGIGEELLAIRAENEGGRK